MAASMWQLRDQLWEVVEPLVPVREPDPRGGRPRVDDQVCFGAIVSVLFTGIAWRRLPRELGCSPAPASASSAGSSSEHSRRCPASADCCTRYERDDGLHLAFMLLGCAVVCQRRLSDA